MKLYFPECHGQVEHVGYNHAISMFGKAIGDHIVDEPRKADARVYCNLPWHPSPRHLKRDRLPLIVYSMYESTRVPCMWVRFLNRHADAVMVPSEWCRQMFENSGVKVPIWVLSLGYDGDKFSRIPKTESLGEYVFMWQGVAIDMGGRKGADVAMKAFRELRAEGRLGDDARMIVKVRPNDQAPLIIDKITDSVGVTYMQEELSRSKMADLYRHVDACINPTHGEGFGLIPLEQMAMGKPVLVTDWSMPYLRSGYYLPLQYELQKSPVTWNHMHLQVSATGIAYNAGGMRNEIPWAPPRIKRMVDGKKTIEFIPSQAKPRPVHPARAVLARCVNAAADFQKRHRLYAHPGRAWRTLAQEYPGMDAHVLVDDLKKKMEWCYRNREEAFDIGFMAREYVSKEWTLNRMENDYNRIAPEIMRHINRRR